MATQYKSHGLFGLPHYRNSRVSQEMWEPVYQNLFTVSMVLPPSIGVDSETTNILLEGCQSIDGLDTHKFPGITTQKYKHATRTFVDSKVDDTSLKLSMNFEVNLKYVDGRPTNLTYKTLRKVFDLAYDPLTGRQGNKVDYNIPLMTVIMHDKGNYVHRGFVLYNLIPNDSLTSVKLDYKSSDLYRITAKFVCDVWDEANL